MHPHLKPAALAAAALLGFAPFASATPITVTFQDGVTNNGAYDGTQDNTIREGADVNNNDGGSYLEARNPSINISKVILKFDLSSLAGQGNVQSTTLHLTQLTPGGTVPSDFSFSVYQLADTNAAWQQGDNVGFSQADAGESCWNYLSYNTVDWAGGANNGLSMAGADYNSTAIATQTYSYGNGTGHVYNITLPATLVQHWIDDPAHNAGVLITSANGSRARFASSEDTSAAGTGTAKFAYRPALDVNYSPVPEPATGALVLIGAGLMTLRRWL